MEPPFAVVWVPGFEAVCGLVCGVGLCVVWCGDWVVGESVEPPLVLVGVWCTLVCGVGGCVEWVGA